ncbi:MAG: DUF2520 domain-containing protein [Eubacterium sp.]|nr:DUF2520 domain-containing protein [Eubacterium sp.]
MKKTGFIGAGKVACSVGKYLTENGIPVSGYYDLDSDNADEAATFTDSRAYMDGSQLISDSDIIFISTPDDKILPVWEHIKTMDIRDKYIGMFSGSLSSKLFSGVGSAGAHGFSLHPMYAFSDRFTDYRDFHTAKLTLEGDEHACRVITDIFAGLGHDIYVIDSEKKYRYHAAASIASNLMIGLYDLSLDMLTDCGLKPDQAVDILAPLVKKNTLAMLNTSPAEALTGPIERGDVETVEHHLSVMSGREAAIYIPLAQRLIDIAEKKNPDRNYDPMRSVVNK